MAADFFEDQAPLPIYRRPLAVMIGLAVIGLAASLLVYLLSMSGIGWPRPVLDLMAVGSKGVDQTAETIHIYFSPNTDAYFRGVGGNYETLSRPWQRYLSDRGLSHKELRQVAQLKGLKSGTLVLPSAAALSIEERDAILDFRNRGGSILATWITGTRNEAGQWAGWDFLTALAGVTVVGELTKDDNVGNVVLNGHSPVSFTMPAGQRLWLGNGAEPLLRIKGPNSGGRFLNWARVPVDEREAETAISFMETGDHNARVVFSAFAESTWEYQPQYIYTLLDDTFVWLRHQAAMRKSDWPDGRIAAQIVEMDTEEGFQNASALADMFRKAKVRGSFFLLTSVAKQFPDVVRDLARDFEVAYHGDIHVGFKGQSADDQRKRLETMKQELATVLPNINNVLGFRAPTESYDKVTDVELHRAGIRHHVADPAATDARLPLFARIEGTKAADGLVMLPRTQRDDINFAKDGLTADQIARAMIDEFKLVQEMGALGVLSVHSQNFGPESAITAAMPGYLDAVSKSSARVWVTSSDIVAEWWRERELFGFHPRSRSAARLEFDLSVKSKIPVKGGSILVLLPRRGAMPKISSLKVGQSLTPRIELLDDFRALVVFDSVPQGDYSYQVSFQGEE